MTSLTADLCSHNYHIHSAWVVMIHKSHLVDGVNFSRDMFKAAHEQTCTFTPNLLEFYLFLTKIVKRVLVVTL